MIVYQVGVDFLCLGVYLINIKSTYDKDRYYAQYRP
jgi:hypothetical protein